MTGRRAAGALTAGLLSVAVLGGCSGGDGEPAPATPTEVSTPPPITPSGTVAPPTSGLPGTLTPGTGGSGIPIPTEPQN
ncbi:hypothetical protein [Modestobacter marinus]|uniref:hypothetical protein n=1 Tax=Modestobacter marinus TaxID=477641 RepID=UPI001C95E089|nr:hypothetical protein [Modestobacter marinus]